MITRISQNVEQVKRLYSASATTPTYYKNEYRFDPRSSKAQIANRTKRGYNFAVKYLYHWIMGHL